MADYIKREDAEKIFVEYNCVKHHVAEMGDTNEANRIMLMFRENAKKLFSLAPTADVAPVRHGRWIVGDSLPMHDIAGNLSWGNWYTCNQCEFKTYAIERHITQYNYCPNCGAKMDEGGTDGTDDC